MTTTKTGPNPPGTFPEEESHRAFRSLWQAIWNISDLLTGERFVQNQAELADYIKGLEEWHGVLGRNYRSCTGQGHRLRITAVNGGLVVDCALPASRFPAVECVTGGVVTL